MDKKLIFFAVIIVTSLLFYSNNAYSETYIGGMIHDELNLNEKDSPYVITHRL